MTTARFRRDWNSQTPCSDRRRTSAVPRDCMPGVHGSAMHSQPGWRRSHCLEFPAQASYGGMEFGIVCISCSRGFSWRSAGNRRCRHHRCAGLEPQCTDPFHECELHNRELSRHFNPCLGSPLRHVAGRCTVRFTWSFSVPLRTACSLRNGNLITGAKRSNLT